MEAKSREQLRTAIGRVICCLKYDSRECEHCAEQKGCPDSWEDLKQDVDQILALVEEYYDQKRLCL